MNLIPVAGVLAKAKMFNTMAKSSRVAFGMTEGAAAQVLAESILYKTQISRDEMDVAVAIGAGAVLGGIIGGLSGRIAQMADIPFEEAKKIVKDDIGLDMSDIPEARAGGDAVQAGVGVDDIPPAGATMMNKVSLALQKFVAEKKPDSKLAQKYLKTKLSIKDQEDALRDVFVRQGVAKITNKGNYVWKKDKDGQEIKLSLGENQGVVKLMYKHQSADAIIDLPKITNEYQPRVELDSAGNESLVWQVKRGDDEIVYVVKNETATTGDDVLVSVHKATGDKLGKLSSKRDLNEPASNGQVFAPSKDTTVERNLLPQQGQVLNNNIAKDADDVKPVVDDTSVGAMDIQGDYEKKTP